MERHGVECTLEARDATYGSLKMIERWSFTHRDAGPLNSEAARWRKAMEDGMTMSRWPSTRATPLYKIVYIAERSEDLDELSACTRTDSCSARASWTSGRRLCERRAHQPQI